MTAVGRGALRARFDFSLSALYLQHPAGPRPEARPFRDWRVGVGKARPLSPGPSWRTHSGTVVVLLGCVLRWAGPRRLLEQLEQLVSPCRLRVPPGGAHGRGNRQARPRALASMAVTVRSPGAET